MRRQVKWLRLPEEVEQQLLARLDRRNINLITLEGTFFDYALLARA